MLCLINWRQTNGIQIYIYVPFSKAFLKAKYTGEKSAKNQTGTSGAESVAFIITYKTDTGYLNAVLIWIFALFGTMKGIK